MVIRINESENVWSSPLTVYWLTNMLDIFKGFLNVLICFFTANSCWTGCGNARFFEWRCYQVSEQTMQTTWAIIGWNRRHNIEMKSGDTGQANQWTWSTNVLFVDFSPLMSAAWWKKKHCYNIISENLFELVKCWHFFSFVNFQFHFLFHSLKHFTSIRKQLCAQT